MTINSNGGPGKTRHLNDIAACCANAGMRVIYAQSDVSQLKALYSGEDGERMAEAVRKNCNIWYPLKPEDGSHDR